MMPKIGETWFVDLGFAAKPRWAYVVGAAPDGRLALATVLTITTQYEATPYEMAWPRVPWLREQSFDVIRLRHTSDQIGLANS